MYLLYQTSVFDDIARIIGNELNFKITTKIMDHNAFHLILDAADLDVNNQYPVSYDIIQFEQRSSKWITEEYLNILRKARYIYDFSTQNHLFLQTKGIQSTLFKFGYSSKWYPWSIKLVGIEQMNRNKDLYDVIFVGKMNDRRYQIIQKLSERFKVKSYDNIHREDLERAIHGTKIVLNLHYYPDAVLEVPRLLTLLLNRAVVISERSNDDLLDQDFEHSINFIQNSNNITIPNEDLSMIIDALTVKIQKILNLRDNEYQDLKLTAYENFKKMELVLPETLLNTKIGIKIDSNQHNMVLSLPEKGIIDFFPATTEQDVPKGIILKLPVHPILEEMPYVSIVTVTRNRPILIQSAIRNWRNFKYPSDRMEWVIIDDSPNEETKKVITNLKGMGGIPVCRTGMKNERINNTNSNPIKYHHLPSENPLPIAVKRNIGCERATYDIIIHMDDDDYYYPDSLMARVKTLLSYQGSYQCVGCIKYGIYDLMDNNSFLFNGPYLSEASMAYFRSFWQVQKFAEHPLGESIPFLKNRRSSVITIPFEFNLIAITHNRNYTGKNRTAKNNDSNQIFKSWDFETQQFYIKMYKQLKKNISS